MLIRALAVTAVAVVAAALSPAEAVAAKPPRRIVSLSPTATESLYAIGAGKQVVAVDDQSDYPKNAPRTKLSGYTPNVEAIARYRPDLVVIHHDAEGLRPALARLRIPVLYQPAAATLADAYAQIRQLGVRTGHDARARRVVRAMKRRIAREVATTARVDLSVYHELTPDYFSAKSTTFIGRVYRLFGLRNIADAAEAASDYPQLSAEFIVAANPDVIVLADTRCCGQNAATVAERPGWSRIAAVRTRTIVRIDDSIASRWGPRVVNYVRAVGSALRSLRTKR